MKKFLSMMLALMMVLSLTTIAWADESNETVVSSGTWGGIDWILTDSGTLTIAPTVNEITKIKPYSEANPKELYQVGEVPAAVNDAISAITGWPFNRTAVKKLVIEDGVTSIGSFALQGLTNLTGEVVIPSTVTYIGQEAFQNSPMTKLIFAEGGTKELCIAPGAFKSTAIEELVFPKDRLAIHVHCWAFNDCLSLKEIVFPANITTFSSQTHLEYSGMDNVYNGDSQVFARCWALKTLTFGSETVKDLFYGAAGNTNNMNAIGGITTAIAPTTYTVTFNSDGGSDIEEQTVVYGGTVTEPADPTKSGYTFGGWYTDAACTTAFDFATEITTATTLYAKWTPNTYTVAFKANSGDGTMEKMTFTYDTAQNLTANAFTRVGYNFAGWATSADGAVAYANGASVSNLTVENNGEVTLYAKWTANTYTVAFNANSGDGTMADMSFTYGTAQNLTANAFTRVGYNFAGWATSADGTVAYANGASVSNLTAENNGEVALYAVWTKIPPAPVYPSVDTPAFDPDEDVDVEDNTLNDAALAVGGAIENGDVKMEPAAGYTVEEITKLQNEGKLNLVIQKKLSYDTTEKSLIDAAITKVGGSASQVDVVYIDVTPVLMTDDGMVVATITDTEKPLTITLDLSAEMQKAAEEGKFISVIRVHDGKVMFLDSKLNAEKTKITFTSSEFSTYAVVAMDKDPSANTFDAGIAMYGVMAVLAATGSAVIIKKRK